MRTLITRLRLLLIPSYSNNKKDKVVYEYQKTDLFNLTNEVLNINGKIQSILMILIRIDL